MRLDLKALAIAGGLLWGGAVLFAGAAHLAWPGYGGAFLDVVSSIYPGYEVGGFGSVIVGALYGLVDGAAAGLILAWLYNTAAGPAASRS
ncbi:MAG TPA: hypothetical protein PKA66_06000 [Gemmatimonadales bacterium]|nr:hypothetical protein [Gemmatimonadales bacterium]